MNSLQDLLFWTYIEENKHTLIKNGGAYFEIQKLYASFKTGYNDIYIIFCWFYIWNDYSVYKIQTRKRTGKFLVR